MAYLKRAAEPHYARSEVSLDDQFETFVLSDERKSQSAFLELDPVTECIIERAASFQGGVDPLQIEALQTVRYGLGDEFRVHFDGDEDMPRISTFFAYLECEGTLPDADGDADAAGTGKGTEIGKKGGARDQCEGGATQFPELLDPVPKEWCDVVECDDNDDDNDDEREAGKKQQQDESSELGGTAFKAKTGNAVFWSNVYPNGTWHEKVLHAGMPVKKGSKIGLNIWTRREAYVAPEE